MSLLHDLAIAMHLVCVLYCQWHKDLLLKTRATVSIIIPQLLQYIIAPSFNQWVKLNYKLCASTKYNSSVKACSLVYI